MKHQFRILNRFFGCPSKENHPEDFNEQNVLAFVIDGYWMIATSAQLGVYDLYLPLYNVLHHC